MSDPANTPDTPTTAENTMTPAEVEARNRDLPDQDAKRLRTEKRIEKAFGQYQGLKFLGAFSSVAVMLEKRKVPQTNTMVRALAERSFNEAVKAMQETVEFKAIAPWRQTDIVDFNHMALPINFPKFENVDEVAVAFAIQDKLLITAVIVGYCTQNYNVYITHIDLV